MLPIFKDIMILFSVHWTSSSYASAQLTEDVVFQNLLYTIKFEPSTNTLHANLVASSPSILRGETLVLDATSSYISNMPKAQQRRSLAYNWRCPVELEALCQASFDPQLVIPFETASVLDKEKPYSFKVTVIWAKLDGADLRETT